MSLFHAQVRDSLMPKYALHVQNSFWRYRITENNTGDIVGRTANFGVCVHSDLKIVGALRGGFALYYTLWNSYFYSSPKNTIYHGLGASTWLGAEYVTNHGKLLYSFRGRCKFNNLQLGDDGYYSDILIKGFNVTCGVEFNMGIRLIQNMYITAGISFNSLFSANYEYNFFQTGLFIPLRGKRNPSHLPQKPAPSY